MSRRIIVISLLFSCMLNACTINYFENTTDITSETNLSTVLPQKTLSIENSSTQIIQAVKFVSSTNTSIEKIDEEKDRMQLILIPSGKFLMGAKDDDLDGLDHEKPQQNIYINSFYIDKTEITNQMFSRFIEETDFQTEAEKKGGAWVYNSETNKWEFIDGASWEHPKGLESNLLGIEQHPVVQVSWNDAQAYCTWVGRRLPSEAEWEKAARGLQGLEYPWGDKRENVALLNFADANLISTWANINVDDGYQFTSPVGNYPEGASPYGVLDMAGNVWEWVADWYNQNYYSIIPQENPKGPDTGIQRVIRGGGWFNIILPVHTRGMLLPDETYDSTGFRCARDYKETDQPEQVILTPTPMPTSTISATMVPTQMVSVAGEATIYYSEEFENKTQPVWSIGYQPGLIADINKKIEEGKYIWTYSNRSTNSMWSEVIEPPVSLPADYYNVAVDVQIINNSEKSECGIIFNYIDRGNYFIFLIDNNGSVGINQRKNNSWMSWWTNIQNFTSLENLIHLDIAISPNKVAIYVNDNFIKSYSHHDNNEGNFLNGKIGIFTISNFMGESIVEYDNFKIFRHVTIPDELLN